jgi:hypothetical protein
MARIQIAVLLAVSAALTLSACGGDGGQEATPSPAASASPPVEATPLPVDARVTFYAADPADNAATLASGDFNGDAETDVLFAAGLADGPDNQRPDGGEAFLFFGPFEPGEERDAAAGEQDVTIFGADEGDQAGRAAAAGDFNGDGIDDILLGAPFGDGPDGQRLDTGEAYVVFGSRDLGGVVDLHDGADLIVYGQAPEDLAGFAVAAADLNGDDADDAIIGAFWNDGPAGDRSNSGAVYAVFGSAARGRSVDLSAGEADATLYGAADGDSLGEAVGAGDLNGDGLSDLVAAAPFSASKGGAEKAGRTFAVFSPPRPSLDLAAAEADFTVYGKDLGDQLGHSLAAADVTGDGVADLLLGAVSADGQDNATNIAGEVALITTETSPAEVDLAAAGGAALVYGADSEDRLGRVVALADLDGDGLAEALLGAPGGAGPRNASPTAGEVFVIRDLASLSGVVQLPAGASALTGDDPGDGLANGVFGRPTLIAADVDGDGRQEIMATAPLGDGPANGRQDCGEAYVVFVRG